jgi:hypothetical protein
MPFGKLKKKCKKYWAVYPVKIKGFLPTGSDLATQTKNWNDLIKDCVQFLSIKYWAAYAFTNGSMRDGLLDLQGSVEN